MMLESDKYNFIARKLRFAEYYDLLDGLSHYDDLDEYKKLRSTMNYDENITNIFLKDKATSCIIKTMYKYSPFSIGLVFAIQEKSGLTVIMSKNNLDFTLLKLYLEYFDFKPYNINGSNNYLEINDGLSSEKIEKYLEIFNNDNNINGKIIKLLLFTSNKNYLIKNIKNVILIH